MNSAEELADVRERAEYYEGERNRLRAVITGILENAGEEWTGSDNPGEAATAYVRHLEDELRATADAFAKRHVVLCDVLGIVEQQRTIAPMVIASWRRRAGLNEIRDGLKPGLGE